MMNSYMQDTRAMRLVTPLGEDELLLQAFSGREAVSSPFEFELDILSENHNLPLGAVTGQRATVALVLGDGGERYTHSYLKPFSLGGGGGDGVLAHYRATLVPWLWLLSRTANCRIFQNKTAREIITQVFQDRGFQDFRLHLYGSYETRTYCVQYRESDFNFVSRLMEEEGIAYFFEHTEDKHTLVLADHPSAFKPCPQQPVARCDFVEGGFLLGEDVVSNWSIGQQVRSGRYEAQDFNFERPRLDLSTGVTGRDERRFEIYDYPGKFQTRDHSEQQVGVRMQEQDAAQVVAAGASNCRAFFTGSRFTLSGHPRRDMNETYLITAINHHAEFGAAYRSGSADDGFTYQNTFECIPHKVPFRPSRVTPVPLVHGTQTATVVGPAGEEIYTDKYGRVKVQFHWDREGKRDANSSCWIRVSQPWAGKGWGAVSIPRIGQEVIVDFLEGDPDRPIITGRVYNAECMPPYELPGGANMMGFKSNSTPGGGGNNEIVICDGKDGELVRIHAQKDMDTTVTCGNQTNTVKTGFQKNTVKGDMTTTVQSGNQKNTVEAGSHSNTAAIQNVMAVGSDGEAGCSFSGAVTIKNDGTIDITAVTKITLQVGGSSITIESGHIVISSPMVDINP